MTISQIEYFLEVARCLSFSEAAKHLYITQPTLNRQISAIEAELNMQLFLRSPKGLTLTPGGIVLYDELSQVIQTFKTGIKKAEKASQGFKGSIRIGIVSGLNVSKELRYLISFFEKKYANIDIVLKQYSFDELISKLYTRDLDVVISYDFHLTGIDDIETIFFKEYHPAWAIPRTNPLSQKEAITYSDLKNEQLVIVSENDCANGVQLIVDKFKKYAGFYPNFYFVENMDTVYLWLKSSNKCALLNWENHLVESDQVKFFDCPDTEETTHVIYASWLKENNNYAMILLKEFLKKNKV